MLCSTQSVRRKHVMKSLLFKWPALRLDGFALAFALTTAGFAPAIAPDIARAGEKG